MQIFIHCKTTLHVSGVTAPIIRSIINCTLSLRYRSYWFVRVACDSHKPVPIRPRWRGVAVQVVRPVPEAAGTVFNTPDDGCCDTRNMQSSFAVNKYLHIVTSVGFLFTSKYIFWVRQRCDRHSEAEWLRCRHVFIHFHKRKSKCFRSRDRCFLTEYRFGIRQ